MQQSTYDPYLQGSYRNDTNIRGDSDVDLVVQLSSAFYHDLSALSTADVAAFNAAYGSSQYGWAQFRSDVLDALVAYYGRDLVKEGKCCLKVKGTSNRLPADVVPCLQYRKYLRFRSRDDESYIEGMRFWTADGREVINFPKWHYDNGVRKNGQNRTAGTYKPVVRMFKNARSYMEDRGLIASSLAPSYFLECFLYNAPDSSFSGSYQEMYLGVLGGILSRNWDEFLCQNEQLQLFGTTPEQWAKDSAVALVQSFHDLWKRW